MMDDRRGPDLVLVMRHATMQRATTPEDLRATPTLRLEPEKPADSALAGLTDVGRALAETLGERHGVGEIYDELVFVAEPTPPALLTARTVRSAYECARPHFARAGTAPIAGRVQTWPVGPVSPYARSGDVAGWVERAQQDLARRAGEAGTRLAVVVVGHEPRMSWLLHRLLTNPRRRYIRAAFVPGLAPAEMVASVREGTKYRACWALSPSDSVTEDAIRAKIKAKMEAAKVYGAVLTALAAFVAKEVAPLTGIATVLGLISLAFFSLAVVLYLVTMFWYDQLTMPPRFWPTETEVSGVRSLGRFRAFNRPPSNAYWVLYQNMMMVWRRCFVPATFSAGLGLWAYAVAATSPARWSEVLVPSGVVVLLSLVAVVVGRWSRPSIGVQD